MLHFYSARNGEKHGGRRRRGAFQREREEDQKTKDYLFQFTASSSEQEISTDSIFGVTGESRAGSVAGTHSDTGKTNTRSLTHTHIASLVAHFLHFFVILI